MQTHTFTLRGLAHNNSHITIITLSKPSKARKCILKSVKAPIISVGSPAANGLGSPGTYAGSEPGYQL